MSAVGKFQKYVNETINDFQNPPIVTYNDISGALPYDKKIRAMHNVHNGQRKLFLSEVEFLSFYYKRAKHVVYAGAADGWHTYLLSTMFNNLKFILVDPRPFELLISRELNHKQVSFDNFYNLDPKKPHTWLETIASKKGVFFINDYYKLSTSEILKPLGSILFISDIRTSDNDEAPSDLDVLWNGAQQINWVEIIKPMYYMLKFRTPYGEDKKINIGDYHYLDFDYSKKLGIDFLANYEKKKFEYLDGKIYLQAWAGPHSTETRLIGRLDNEGKIIKKTYDALEYEQKLYYFNTISRSFGYFANAYGDKRLGFDHCQDCALENKIWEYYNTFVTQTNIKTGIKTLNEVTRRSLFIPGKHNPQIIHGYMFNPDRKWYEDRIKSLNLPLTIQYNIPNREQEHLEPENVNYNTMIDNITGLLQPEFKDIYTRLLEECRAQKKGPPILKMSEVKQMFKLTWGVKLYYSSMVNFSFSQAGQIIMAYHWHAFKYLFLDSILVPIENDVFTSIAKILNIVFIHCGLPGKADFPGFDKLETGRYYEFSMPYREMKIPIEIAEKAILYPTFNNTNFSGTGAYQNVLISMAKSYNDIRLQKVKYYTVRMSGFLDEWIKPELNFDDPEIKLAQANGFDIHKSIYEEKKNLFPSGEMFLIPFGARVQPGVCIMGESDTFQMTHHEWKEWDYAFYKNTFTRNFQIFDNPYAMKDYGFDCCLDCASLSKILETVAKKNKITDVKKFIQASVKMIFGATMQVSVHGYLFGTSDDDLLNAFRKESLIRLSLRKKIGGKRSDDFFWW